MIRYSGSAVSPTHAAALGTCDERLRESSRFHMGLGDVHRTLKQVAADLDEAGIDYAIIGGMALNAHGYRRETVDVDILVRPEGLDAFHARFAGRGYLPAFDGARKTFRNTQTKTKVEFIATGEYPGDGKPKEIAFPDPARVAETIEGVRYVTLPVLIELKLASGMTNPGRLKDLGDVQELIRAAGIPAEFSAQLSPYVRQKFVELWSGVQQDRSAEE